MRTTYNNLMAMGIALAVTAGFAVTALAGGPPYDAGFKARGMHEAAPARAVMRTYAAPQATYRTFSYAPQAQAKTVVAPQTKAAVAPVQAKGTPAVNGARRFSYEPTFVAPTRVYRNWNYGVNAGRGHTGYGGDYASKANLYK